MKKYLLVEVKKEADVPGGDDRQQFVPAETSGIDEFGWFLPSRIIEAESMTKAGYPDGDQIYVFHGVREPETEKDQMQKWIDQEPRANAGIFWTAGQAHFQLQDYEKARLAWFTKMPGREG